MSRSAQSLAPWWLAALGALGLGAYIAVPDLTLSKWGRLFVRAALVAGSTAGTVALTPSLLRERFVLPEPLSQRAGIFVSFAASLVTSPVLGDKLVDRLASALAARGMSWPRARLGVIVTTAALIGEAMQRFPPPPRPRTPPPRRSLVRPDPTTIIRN